MSIELLAGIVSIVAASVTVGIWVGKRSSFEKTTDKAIHRIDASVEKINENIGSMNVNVAILTSRKPVDESQSPTRLNEFDESISKEVRGKEWAKGIASQYVDQLEKSEPYDVQQFGYRHAQQFEPSQEMLAKMKKSAWENGIPIDLIRRVLALELRDALLEILGMEFPEESPLHTRPS